MDYSSKTVKELRNIAKEKGMIGYSRLRKIDLVAFVSCEKNMISSRLKEINSVYKMDYSSKTVKELRNIAKEKGMVGYSRLRKADLVAFVSCEKNMISTRLKEINSVYKMDYSSKTVKELRNIAKEKGMVGYSRLRKAELVAFVSCEKNIISTWLKE